MEVLGALLPIGFVAWLIYTQFSARSHHEIVTSKSQAQVEQAVDAVFGTKQKNRVPGKGRINIRPRWKRNAPTVSIDLKSTADSTGVTVAVWMSEWETRYGIAGHAAWVWRKKGALRRALLAGE